MTVEVNTIRRKDRAMNLSETEAAVYRAAVQIEEEKFDLKEVRNHLSPYSPDSSDLADIYDALSEKGFFIHYKRDTYNGPEHSFEARDPEGIVAIEVRG